MSTDSSERRRITRHPASGRVRISFQDPTPVTVEADLVETSTDGFRIAHESNELNPGLEVRLQRGPVAEHARVVWTHFLDGRRVSGCVLL